MKYACIGFAKRFLQESIPPFSSPIEYMDVFHDVIDQSTEASANLESAVMGLCHGNCHSLTVALGSALNQPTVILFSHNEEIAIHSALYNRSENTVLDANGIHTIDDAKAFWSTLTGVPVVATELPLEEIEYLCDPEIDAEYALEGFECIYQFIKDHCLDRAPTSPRHHRDHQELAP